MTISVNATTLDAEWKARGLPLPKLIKVDTEGAEQFVLEGARDLLAGCKVPFVVANCTSSVSRSSAAHRRVCVG